MTVIEFEHVSRRFEVKRDRRNSFHEVVTGLFKPRLPSETFWALRDVSFKINKGETIGLIGHNGSGKSTTLKLITRILQPTSGQVLVDGRVSALLELGSGFHPDLTGRENIYLNGSLLGFTRAEMSSKINAIIDFSEMREFIDMPVKHYSSGMYMRLGFAVAIYVDPDILITDEVLAVGDEAFQRKCMERIYSLKRRGKTILFVSHALGQVRDLCDRALWFNHGELLLDSAPSSAIDAYLFDTNQRDSARRKAEAQAQSGEAEEIEESTAEASDNADEVSNADETAEEHEPEVNLRRWGTLDAEISKVELLDAAGQASLSAYTGEPLTIRVHYRTHKPIEQPVFGVAIHHQNGMHINGPNSRFSGLDIPRIDGVGFIDYHIEALPLLEGEYELTAAIYDYTMSVAIDHQDRSWSLRVYTRSIDERYGVVYIPAAWNWVPADGAGRSSASEALKPTLEQQ